MSIARWNLKEAEGKTLVRRTEIRYEAAMRDEEANIFKVQNLHGAHSRISGGYKWGRECALPGEISDRAIELAPLREGDDAVGEVSRYHSRPPRG